MDTTSLTSTPTNPPRFLLLVFLLVLSTAGGCFLFNIPPYEVRKNIAIIRHPDRYNSEQLAQAARRLRTLQDPAAIEPLIELLKNDDPWVRADAQAALINITNIQFDSSYETWKSWWDQSGEDWLAQQREIENDPDISDSTTREQRALVMRDYGEVALKVGYIPAAIRHFQIAVESEPANPENHIGLGRAYRMNLEYVKAEKEFKTAAGLNPAMVEPFLNLGICSLEQNKFIDAIAYLKKAKEKDDARVKSITSKANVSHVPYGEMAPNWQVLWYLGVAHFSRRDKTKRDYQLAAQYIEDVIKILPPRRHTVKMYLQLALAYYGDNQYLKSWRMIQGLERAFPDKSVNPDFRNKVKWMLFTKYEYDFSKDGEEPPRMSNETFDDSDYRKILSGNASSLGSFSPESSVSTATP